MTNTFDVSTYNVFILIFITPILELCFECDNLEKCTSSQSFNM